MNHEEFIDRWAWRAVAVFSILAAASFAVLLWWAL